ncbi:MAG: pyruvate formate lyase activating enzyme [Archaeoglobi archaeon]|nr:AmmeMemoRadiSam system radical SAM enzyme [Candidatus Mnemosynella bozhongmuii]MDI3502902.1 pyruvate formate lyase activating enzyme [Archaeoglobi archaeon]MDK2782104.1 pyruvate formate lyase activating enzyme [Archaeoglobi archaeon]
MTGELYEKLNGDVRCKVCAHYCRIKPGASGICGVRKNLNGEIISLIYGKVSSTNIDPIEKKPLYHFLPGSLSYSFGSVGCNFSCSFCQNFTISQEWSEEYLYELPPESLVRRVIESGCPSVSWTYNEPTIWFEYTRDCSIPLRERGVKVVYVTNGYMSEESLEEIVKFVDAFSLDIKSFSEDFYRKICRGKLEVVLENAVKAKRKGVHIEVVNLVIPGYNDSEREIEELSRWIVENLGDDTPVHFTRFHPDYRMMDVPPTPLRTLERAYEIAKREGLLYVYVGNVMSERLNSTFCPNCNELLIARRGFSSKIVGLEGDRCRNCNTKINVILE